MFMPSIKNADTIEPPIPPSEPEKVDISTPPVLLGASTPDHPRDNYSPECVRITALLCFRNMLTIYVLSPNNILCNSGSFEFYINIIIHAFL